MTERRRFNAWFYGTFQDADGRFDHLPRWLKADLWLAWETRITKFGTKVKFERKRFNAWYRETFSDPDGSFTHLPSWLKDDLWLAWLAPMEAAR